ncbi:gonadotropin-releasing hormone receptor isoform X2 [Odontomachus brunneus]|uniref:gonadotropin-releasing hormone receptor isoform X2 n=1 Tax=Odontomachus brunneus TaxID=486640 RepID=UPI0013F2ABA9|nr:gonadotropin-releasing hormone receptor isoform X2 [Odontomachus brunneus]
MKLTMNSISITVAPEACDNLTNFVGHTLGLDLKLNPRPRDNLSDFSEIDLYENVTCLEHAPKLTDSVYFKVIVLAVMSVLSLACNLATIYSIRKNRRKQRVCSTIYTLLLHLSVADLLVTVFCMAGDAIWSYNVAWLWGNVACKLFKFLQMFSLYLSTFVLVLIGVDRFVAVRYPMKGLSKNQRCSRFVLFVWILSFVLATPQIAIFHVAEGPFVEVFTQCVTHGFYTEAWQEQLYASFSLFFMFLLPLAILITTYVSTVITLSRSQRTFKGEPERNGILYTRSSDLNRRRLMHRAKTKSLRISVVIVAAFLIWWTPYYTMMIIFLFLNPDKHFSDDLQSGIFFFGMSNSLVNPLIYGAFHLWPQKQRKDSYHRSEQVMMQQRNSMKKARDTQTSLLSHQDSGNKVNAQQRQI